MRYRAAGESLSGCHEISNAIAEQFIALGGEDIQVWDTDYIIDSLTLDAAQYVTVALNLSNLERIEDENV